MDAVSIAGTTKEPRLMAIQEGAYRWWLGLLAASAMTLLSSFPQFQLWILQSGTAGPVVAYNQGLGDEVAYAAYLNALISGRPRRNDPYTGRDDSPETPQAESLFSIQFIPAYAMALPARALGISATSLFILLTPLTTFTVSLALFWLINLVTGNDSLAATGVLVVLCLGALVSAEGAIRNWTGATAHFDYFPFLRRYQPAASFPIFLTMCLLSWQALTVNTQSRAFRYSLGSGILFGLLVFSYFYLWTAAAAWIATVGILSLIMRLNDRALVLRYLSTMGVCAGVALTPYLILLAHRADTTETVQALVLSRKPDLFSACEVVAAAVLMLLITGIIRGAIDRRDPRVIFALSFALLPFVVLNQQILTGRVLQPIHYKGFITNYSVLIAMVLSCGLVWKRQGGPTFAISKRALLWIALAAFDWGLVETYQAANRSFVANQKAAEEMAVYVRLKEESSTQPKTSNRPLVLFTDLRMADNSPAVVPQAVLWAPHLVVYSGANAVESKERLYRHLYYTGVGPKELEDYLYGRKVYYGCAVGLFGFDRFIDGLNPNAKPISSDEKQEELLSYSRYIAAFDWERAANPQLSIVVVPVDDQPDLSNLDRWYERDAGESVAKFILYHLRLRNQESAVPSRVARHDLQELIPKRFLKSWINGRLD